MKNNIHIEGNNFLTLRKIFPFNGYIESKNNVLFELTTFESSKFIIATRPENPIPLASYSERDNGGPNHPGMAAIYEVTNEKRVEHTVVIHQAFFKLSDDGNLRKLGFQAWQMEEIITGNNDLFPKTNDWQRDWIAYFLIESKNAIYPVSVRPYRHNSDLYKIGLENLSDLSHYACVHNTFFIGR